MANTWPTYGQHTATRVKHMVDTQLARTQDRPTHVRHTANSTGPAQDRHTAITWLTQRSTHTRSTRRLDMVNPQPTHCQHTADTRPTPS